MVDRASAEAALAVAASAAGEVEAAEEAAVVASANPSLAAL